MNILEIAKREVLGSAEESNTVVVTSNENFICE